MVLDPGGLLGWLIVGLIAGQVMKGGGSGMIGDIVLGIVGACVGGLLVGVLGFGAAVGFWGTIVVAFLGACFVIALMRAVAPGRNRLWR